MAKNLKPAPFFARFLESQEALNHKQLSAVQGGAGEDRVTQKWPSDRDEATAPSPPDK